MKGKFNAKALFTNHIEKIGFGLIALMVGLIWASEFFGGSWGRTKENPDTILSEIEKKKADIERSKWPAEKKEKFELVDLSERAATLLRPINNSKYELSTDLFVPLYRPKEKAREPEYRPIESLQADAGHVLLRIAAPSDEQLEDGMESEKKEGEEMEDEEFVVRNDGAGGLGRAGLPGGGRDKGGLDKGGGRPIPIADSKGGKGVLDGPLRAGMDGGMGTPTAQAKGRFYVAVRGVWPIKQQLDQIKRALHLPTEAAAMEYLDINDFELERQVATAGDDPWKGNWEKLNISVAEQILEETDGFDDEPTSMQVFDTVITMPLPMRMFGLWKDHATHPRIKNYILSPEEEQREKLWQERIKEEFEKAKLEEEKTNGPPKKGFNSQSNDFRGMYTNMAKQDPKMMAETVRQMAKEPQRPGMKAAGGPGGLTPNDLTDRITAVGRLLLFRYFDFDVQPGYAYRYRVRLKLINPLKDKSVGEVVNPDFIKGEFRPTEWSNISNAAVMPVAPVYFLKEVDKNPLADDGKHKKVMAEVSVYDWHKKMGTRVYKKLAMGALGQFLGGTAKTDVLDVATPSFEEDEYTFTTEDVLLDVAGDAELLPEDHPLLALPDKRKGSKVVTIGLASEAMVVDAGGELRHLEANGESAAEKALKKDAERERRQFKDLPKKEDGAGSLDILGADPTKRPGMAGSKGESKKDGKKEANPRKKKKGKGDDAMAGGRAGMMAPPEPGGKSKGKAKGKGSK